MWGVLEDFAGKRIRGGENMMSVFAKRSVLLLLLLLLNHAPPYCAITGGKVTTDLGVIGDGECTAPIKT